MAELLKEVNKIKHKLNLIDIIDKLIAIKIKGPRSKFNRVLEYLESKGILVDEDTWGKAYNKYGQFVCISIETKEGIMYSNVSWYLNREYTIYDYDETSII